MYTGCIGTAGQIEPAFARLRAKIPKRNASLRKSLRSILYQALRGQRVYILRPDGPLVLKTELLTKTSCRSRSTRESFLKSTNSITSTSKHTSTVF